MFDVSLILPTCRVKQKELSPAYTTGTQVQKGSAKQENADPKVANLAIAGCGWGGGGAPGLEDAAPRHLLQLGRGARAPGTIRAAAIVSKQPHLGGHAYIQGTDRIERPDPDHIEEAERDPAMHMEARKLSHILFTPSAASAPWPPNTTFLNSSVGCRASERAWSKVEIKDRKPAARRTYGAGAGGAVELGSSPG